MIFNANRWGAIPLALALSLAGLTVSGCMAGGSPLEGLGALNPFKTPEKRMPGERRPALPTADALSVDSDVAARPVNLPGATANANWSQPGGEPGNAPGHLALTGSGAPAWSANVTRVDRRERLTAPPIVHQGYAIVMDNNAQVTAYSMSGGGRGWTANLRPQGEEGRGVGGGVAAEGGVVVASTPYGKVHGLDVSSGGQVWEADLGASARGAPTISNGRAYVISSDNKLHAIQVADGSVLWSYTGIGASAGVIGNTSPAVAGGTVVVPYTSGEIVAFEPQSGDPKWFDALAGAGRAMSLSGLSDVVARPVIYDGVVYAVSVSGRMIAVSANRGERLWAQSVASSHTPAIAGNSIFVATTEGELVALERASGKVRWRTDIAQGQQVNLAGPLLAGGRLWVGTSDGRMITADPSSGTVTSEQRIGSPVFISPIAANGRVLVLDNSGRLTAFN